MDKIYDKIHKLSLNNKKLLSELDSASCFYCLNSFPTADIKEWVDDEKTALCPICGIDSVIPNNLSLKVDNDLLEIMHKHYF